MKKLIYIDDEVINLELFKINLKNHYEIFLTDSPIKALEIIESEKIDIVITDYKMPVMNGMELINNIKDVIHPNAVCMILSGYMESEVVTDKSKVFKYIMKPYRKEEIIRHIESAFSHFSRIAWFFDCNQIFVLPK